MTETIRKLLNRLNLGTQKAAVGDYIASLEKRIEQLESKVAVLEAAP